MSRWVGRTLLLYQLVALGPCLGSFQAHCRQALPTHLVSVGNHQATKYISNNSCRAVFPDGLVHKLGRQGWEWSSQELLLPLVTMSQPSWFPVAPSSIVFFFSFFLSSGFYEGSSGHSQSVNIPSRGNGGDCGAAVSSRTPPWLFVWPSWGTSATPRGLGEADII